MGAEDLRAIDGLTMEIPLSIADVKTRQQAVDYLEGYAGARRDELADDRLGSGLVKSYMLETVAQHSGPPDLESAFRSLGARLVQIDDSLWKIWADGSPVPSDRAHLGGPPRWVGFIEQLIPRYPVLYTNEPSRQADAWVRRLVQTTATLDNVWLSGIIFYQLWQRINAFNGPNTYGKIGFAYESIFDIDADEARDGDEADTGPEDESLEDVSSSGEAGAERQYEGVRRSSRFLMADRIGRMREALDKMREIYDPLQAISMLRFPSRARSGHDFYSNGKVTNRSDSFVEHRSYLEYVLRIYQQVTEQTESTAWADNGIREHSAGNARLSAPVVIRFLGQDGSPNALEQHVFEQWITSTFGRKNNRFRLWGRPIRLGPGKVHVYGADRHLWQPISLELTRHHAVALLPKGTCGNTIHRLVTNIQRYVCPNVSVSIGDLSLAEVIGRAVRGDAAPC